MNLLRLISFISLLLVVAVHADDINPPFGLHWGETAERMERLLHGAKATVVDRHLVDGKEAWEVEGLLQAGLKRTVFYFHRGELVEVELQYQQDQWDDAKYDGFMGDVRKRLEQKYGEGQCIARRTEQDPPTDIMQKLIGYKWNLNNSAIELIYFAATDATNAWRTLSVHYKTY